MVLVIWGSDDATKNDLMLSGEALKAFNDLSAGDGFSAQALARIEAATGSWSLRHIGVKQTNNLISRLMTETRIPWSDTSEIVFEHSEA